MMNAQELQNTFEHVAMNQQVEWLAARKRELQAWALSVTADDILEFQAASTMVAQLELRHYQDEVSARGLQARLHESNGRRRNPAPRQPAGVVATNMLLFILWLPLFCIKNMLLALWHVDDLKFINRNRKAYAHMKNTYVYRYSMGWFIAALGAIFIIASLVN